MKQNPRILVVKYNAIGDVLNVTPALRLMKDVLKECSIDMLVGRWAEPAIRHHPALDRVFILENEWFIRPGLATSWKLARLVLQLRRMRYDAVVAFQRSRAFRWLITALHPPVWAMFGGQEAGGVGAPLDEEIHVIPNNIALARQLLARLGCGEEVISAAVRNVGLTMDWTISDEERQEAASIPALASLPSGTRLFACFPGGGKNPMNDEGAVKQWGVDRFVDLLGRLSALPSTSIFLLGGPADREVCREVALALDGKAIDLSGALSLRTTAALLEKCALVIGNDSGPMHIAGAVGVPLVAIFGPTGARKLLPPGEKSFAVQSALHCSPCFYAVYKGCLYEKRECLLGVTVDAVFNTALDALRAPQRSAGDELNLTHIRLS